MVSPIKHSHLNELEYRTSFRRSCTISAGISPNFGVANAYAEDTAVREPRTASSSPLASFQTTNKYIPQTRQPLLQNDTRKTWSSHWRPWRKWTDRWGYHFHERNSYLCFYGTLYVVQALDHPVLALPGTLNFGEGLLVAVLGWQLLVPWWFNGRRGGRMRVCGKAGNSGDWRWGAGVV